MIKQPFSYYGGKQRIASKIIPYIPRHAVYVEPFCGGATILFNKKTPKITNSHHYREIINDTNDMVINFYRVLQDEKKAKKLIYKLEMTPYSQTIHKECKNKNKNQIWENDIDKAYCFYVGIQKGFSNILNSGFGYEVKGRNSPSIFLNKTKNLYSFVDRLKKVYIFNEDALNIIKRFDSPQSFFYIDPPYLAGASQGHYAGYTEKNYKELLTVLENLRGNFVLSCYKTGLEPNKWKEVNFSSVNSSANGKQRLTQNTKRTETIFIKDNGGGIEQEYFRKTYNRPEFAEIWPIEEKNNV